MKDFGHEPRFYRWATIAGIVAIVFALLLIIAWWVDRARELAGNLGMRPYEISRVGMEEVDDFHEFCESILGEGVASKERMRQWQGKNPKHSVSGVLGGPSCTTQKAKAGGVLQCVSCKQGSRRSMWRNQLKGTEMGPQHIVSAGRRPAAIYIGGVGAKGNRAKQHTLGALVSQVALLGAEDTLIFTRPINSVGRQRAT